MSKKLAVLLLSDLHIEKNKNGCQLYEGVDGDYYHKFKNYILDKDIQNEFNIKYLVITGDIVESGMPSQYKLAEEILDRLCTDLDIHKNNVLLIPGNHDVSRDRLSVYCEDNEIPINEAFKHNDIKFECYKKFYEKFTGKELDVNASILSTIDIEGYDLSFLGINTNVKECQSDDYHYGFIDTDRFEDDYKKVKHKANAIVSMHHGISDIKTRDLPTIKNWENCLSTFERYNIQQFIYGHHHISDSKSNDMGDDEERKHDFITIGSFGKIVKTSTETINNRFNILYFNNETEFSLIEYMFSASRWLKVDDRYYKHNFSLKKNDSLKQKTDNSEEPDSLIGNINRQISNDKDIKDEQSNILISEDAEKIVNYLKKGKLYEEGHYHWSNGVNTLGWVNIGALLGNVNVLELIRQEYINFATKQFSSTQVIVGYGLEGNIIGSALSGFCIEKDIPYYYMPSIHKVDEFNAEEQKLWKICNDYSRISIIFDFIPDKVYLQEILAKDDCFSNCCELYVYGFIYNDLLIQQLPSELILTGREGERKIRVTYFATIKLSIPICKKCEDECFLNKNNLVSVIEL